MTSLFVLFTQATFHAIHAISLVIGWRGPNGLIFSAEIRADFASHDASTQHRQLSVAGFSSFCLACVSCFMVLTHGIHIRFPQSPTLTSYLKPRRAV